MAVIPQGSYGALAPAVGKTLTPADAAWVATLPSAGSISGVDRVRLTQIQAASAGVDPHLNALCTTRLAQ